MHLWVAPPSCSLHSSSPSCWLYWLNLSNLSDYSKFSNSQDPSDRSLKDPCVFFSDSLVCRCYVLIAGEARQIRREAARKNKEKGEGRGEGGEERAE